MIRGIAGVVTGCIVWIVVATLGNLAVRAALPGYADAERAMSFTLGMMGCRLVVGAVATVVAGAAASGLAKGSLRIGAVLGALLIAIFIPVHIGLWEKFPVWYHLAFLGSLLPLTLVGAALVHRRRLRGQPGPA